MLLNVYKMKWCAKWICSPGEKHPEVNTHNQKQVSRSKQVFVFVRESSSSTETLILCSDGGCQTCSSIQLCSLTLGHSNHVRSTRSTCKLETVCEVTFCEQNFHLSFRLFRSVSSFSNKSLEDNIEHWCSQWPEHCSTESKHSHRPTPSKRAKSPTQNYNRYWQSQLDSPALTINVVNEPVFH